MEMKFLSRYGHWLLLLLIVGSLAESLISGRYDAPSLVFGIIGALGIGYLVFRVESDRKKKNHSKSAR